jgi:hypothetical protein
MKAGHYQLLARMGVGVSTLLWVHAFGLSGTLSAGCNHPIGTQTIPLVVLDDLIVAGSSAIPLVAHFPDDKPAPGRRRPCSGMSCSNSIPLPASTASPGSDGSDQWGTLSSRANFEAMTAHTLMIDDAVKGQLGWVRSIFHPPPFSMRKV